MKLVLFVILGLSLFSCKKSDNVLSQEENRVLYFRVEAVTQNGEVLEVTPIKTLKY